MTASHRSARCSPAPPSVASLLCPVAWRSSPLLILLLTRPPPFLIWQVQLFFALLSSVALRFDQDTLSQNRGSNFEALLVVVTVLPAALAIFFDTVVPWLGRKKRQQLRGRISEGVDKAKEVSAKAKEVSARVREISGKALLRRSAADSESESHKDAAPVAEPGHPSRASRVSHASIKVLNQRCRQTSHV